MFYSLYLQGNAGQMSKYAYLIIRDQNNTFVINSRLEINNQVAYGTVPLSDTLNTGIYQIICYTSCMRNHSEELYFNKEIVIANRFDKKLNLFPDSLNVLKADTSVSQDSVNKSDNGNLVLRIDRKVFYQREKISFSIETGSIPGNLTTRLSVSVKEIIQGIPTLPSIYEYFNNTTKWENKVESKESLCRFTPEINGAVIEGNVLKLSGQANQSDSVKNIDAGLPPPYTLLVSTTDSIVNLQYTSTDSSGSFRIHLSPYYEGKDLFIRIKENVKATIQTENKFNLIQPFYPSGNFNVPGFRPNLLRSENIVQVQKFYNLQQSITTLKEFLPGGIVPRIYFRDYSTVFPSDFIEMNDFLEISKEIVPALKVRKVGDKYVSGYINFQDQANKTEEPSFFLDGVPIDDVNQILSLGTRQIKRIESLPFNRYYGDMTFQGILALFSKDLLINRIEFKTPTIKYQSLSSQSYTKQELYKPVDVNSHIPDMRQLLLWDPDIVLKKSEKKQIEFYASDLQGKYLINIQGITNTGEPVNCSATIVIQSRSK